MKIKGWCYKTTTVWSLKQINGLLIAGDTSSLSDAIFGLIQHSNTSYIAECVNRVFCKSFSFKVRKSHYLVNYCAQDCRCFCNAWCAGRTSCKYSWVTEFRLYEGYCQVKLKSFVLGERSLSIRISKISTAWRDITNPLKMVHSWRTTQVFVSTRFKP